MISGDEHTRAMIDSLKGRSEAILGEMGASKDFVIHTKAPGIVPGSMKRQSMFDGMEKSLKDLDLKMVSKSNAISTGPSTKHQRLSLTYTTCMVRILRHQLKRLYLPCRKCMLWENSKRYAAPWNPSTRCGFNTNLLQGFLIATCAHSSVSQIIGPKMSKEFMTFSRLQTRSYRHIIKVIITQ